MGADVAIDFLDEIGGGVEGAAADCALGDEGEEAFDLVEPGWEDMEGRERRRVAIIEKSAAPSLQRDAHQSVWFMKKSAAFDFGTDAQHLSVRIGPENRNEDARCAYYSLPVCVAN